MLSNLVKSRFVEMFGSTGSILLSSWETVKLDECVTSIDTGSSPQCKAEPREGMAPGVLKLSALSSGSYLSSENKAMEEGSEIPREKEVLQGDLLVARKNTPELVGACVLVDEPASNLMFPDLVFRMHPTEAVDGRYLVTLLTNSPYASEVRNLAHGTAKSMSNIPKSALSKLPIPIPPKTLQRELASFVHQIDKSRSVVQKAIQQMYLLWDILTLF